MKNKDNEFKEKIVAMAKIKGNNVNLSNIKKEPITIIDKKRIQEVAIPSETKEEKAERIKRDREIYLSKNRKQNNKEDSTESDRYLY